MSQELNELMHELVSYHSGVYKLTKKCKWWIFKWTETVGHVTMKHPDETSVTLFTHTHLDSHNTIDDFRCRGIHFSKGKTETISLNLGFGFHALQQGVHRNFHEVVHSLEQDLVYSDWELVKMGVL